MSNKLTWGDNHVWYIKSLEQAKLYAYEKAFYFENVYLNGHKISRAS